MHKVYMIKYIDKRIVKLQIALKGLSVYKCNKYHSAEIHMNTWIKNTFKTYVKNLVCLSKGIQQATVSC
jgi:hypothetical protein